MHKRSTSQTQGSSATNQPRGGSAAHQTHGGSGGSNVFAAAGRLTSSFAKHVTGTSSSKAAAQSAEEAERTKRDEKWGAIMAFFGAQALIAGKFHMFCGYDFVIINACCIVPDWLVKSFPGRAVPAGKGQAACTEFTFDRSDIENRDRFGDLRLVEGSDVLLCLKKPRYGSKNQVRLLSKKDKEAALLFQSDGKLLDSYKLSARDSFGVPPVGYDPRFLVDRKFKWSLEGPIIMADDATKTVQVMIQHGPPGSTSFFVLLDIQYTSLDASTLAQARNGLGSMRGTFDARTGTLTWQLVRTERINSFLCPANTGSPFQRPDFGSAYKQLAINRRFRGL